MNKELKSILQGVADEFNPKIWAAYSAVMLFGYQHEQAIFDLFGLDTRQRNIVRERYRMSPRLWYYVLNHYQWRCAKCRTQNWKNKEWGKPKMQVDHVKSLYNFGKTEWNNLQVLCAPCNRWKGVKNIDYR